jgi:DVNP family
MIRYNDIFSKMVKRLDRHDDGFYHVKGKKYEMLEGSRAQVWHDTAYKTPGGLTKSDLVFNKHGRIVSAKKHVTAKKENRLRKYGYTARKGKFGAIKISKTGRRSRLVNTPKKR